MPPLPRLPIFSEETWRVLRCDFSYMIGPDMFREFVNPELALPCLHARPIR